MRVFITGGTKGIGKGLSQWYIGKGYKVGICGRTPIDWQHANLSVYAVDVSNRGALERAVDEFCDGQALDIIIIAAGAYCDDITHKVSQNELATVLQTNIVGVVNALEIGAQRIVKAQQGKIAVIASVSGMLNYPNSTIYAKSKRAVIAICDTYRQAIAQDEVSLTCIMPGYVDTEKLRALNNGDASNKPFLVSVDYAVKTIVEAIDNSKPCVIFPPKMRRLIKLLSLLPKCMLGYVMTKHKTRNASK